MGSLLGQTGIPDTVFVVVDRFFRRGSRLCERFDRRDSGGVEKNPQTRFSGWGSPSEAQSDVA